MTGAPHHADRTEALAFQLILDKLRTLEEAIAGMVPLLEQIVRHLEAQKSSAEVPIATPEQLYADLRTPETVKVEGTEVQAPRRLKWGIRSRP